MLRLLDSEFKDSEHLTFLGRDPKFVADLAFTCTVFAAFTTVFSVILHTSDNATLRMIGELLGVIIWLVFLVETLIMVRLHHGWGIDWLRTHKLQLVVITLANPLLVWAIGRIEVLELSLLLPLPSFLKAAKMSKLFKLSKILKFLHLSEVVTKVRAALAHLPWLVNSVFVSIGIVVLGIIGSVAEGGALTPLHALDVWLRAARSIAVAMPQVLLATAPLMFALTILVITSQKRRVTKPSRGI